VVVTERHRFNPSILREYDIRGIVGETLGERDARYIGQALVTILRRRGASKPVVCIGYDGRLSSPALKAALIDGAMTGGAEVIRLGCGPTPMLYFAVNHFFADGGIMVTGSHNPPSHNGFKIMVGRKSFYGDSILELGRLAEAGDLEFGQGTCHDEDLLETYVDCVLQELADVDLSKLAVGWDAGNGAAGTAMRQISSRIGGRHVLINATIDGMFPAHHPDPTNPENLRQLQEVVREQTLDLGIAFDGDGDRIGAIDGRGRIVWGDQLLAILARDVLAEFPGSTIIADVKASQVLFERITDLGGKPLMWKTGHSLIKDKMGEISSPLAGEMSGHLFFADRYYGYDDALYAAVRLLKVVSRDGCDLATLRDQLPSMVNTPELRFDCPDYRKFQIVAEVRAQLERSGARFDATDGVRVSTPDGWWLLRASNTQAVLVAWAEARDQPGLSRLIDELRSHLGRSGITARIR
jgi:phosphomannomutase